MKAAVGGHSEESFDLIDFHKFRRFNQLELSSSIVRLVITDIYQHDINNQFD